ncbi:aminotransferase class I/II-fold pyridoxal phosphate-dependent enzyme [Xanthocytophaga agilis]|uniref:Aminotransferase class I/II-fold pyridoxal phosphate-dependent enzyme n=1 Tax=Xanthocytophaga agilis TaxID=3048010 RepID=A0AAE3QYD8_9BACT|nr:aminotransferase class I/II-fold pyridoxal phosphate-dependent enzyme [Xanthocytophaga agilis]MDJ1500381.1 aminotransferase class I/II-fold pyridoxal phosphate-dependent enzyme [Xanthocytophaga agilis]
MAHGTPEGLEYRGSIFDKCYAVTKADQLRNTGIYPYFRAIQESEGPEVIMEGRKIVMAGSNNYLGLTTHPQVKEAAIKAIEQYGTSSSGSRFLTGTLDLHNELEMKLAKFIGKEAALLFSTGYQTSQGVLFPLVGRSDYIFSDHENHASIVAGMLLARGALNAPVVRYHHNDMEDLEKRLQRVPAKAGKIIVTDGVFSTFGDIVPLDQLCSLAKKYHAQVLIDDAHSFGVLGEGGRGTANHYGLNHEVDLVFSTFSKTLASIGGFVAGEKRVIDYLKHESSAFMFSCSPSASATAAALAALHVLQTEPELIRKLHFNAKVIRTGLQQMGYDVPDGQTAIVPVLLYDDAKACQLWQGLYDEGIFVNVFIAPAIPPGRAMLRTSLMASLEGSHLSRILEAYKKIGKRLRII